MIFVDSSVWIDFFRGTDTAEAAQLDRLLGTEEIVVGDIVLTEVLQGFVHDRDFEAAQAAMAALTVIAVVDPALAIAAAQNFRRLRGHGITVRKTIDTLIATRCIIDDWPLLYSDRDFDPFVAHLGLVPALH